MLSLKFPDEEAEKHFRSQHTFLSDLNGDIIVDFVGKFERLDDDLRTVCRHMGVEYSGIPHLQKSRREGYRILF